MRVFCTGISGVGATDYIDAVREYAESRNEEIKVFNVGREVSDLAEKTGYPITPTGVLDLNKRTITSLTHTAYQKIAGEIGKYKNAIIDAHINFRWRGVVTPIVTFDMIEPLQPDVYVTLMDLARPIVKRLKEDKEQWKYEIKKGNITIANTLDLQNFEVNMTEQMARYHEYIARCQGKPVKRKPMHVLPTNDSPDSLYKLATRENTEVAYASFPITHIMNDEESRKKIDYWVAELRKFEDLAIISPRSVELPSDPSPIENQHTVAQDLEWFVEKSTHRIFVYFPKKVYSRGVDHESIKAKESCKEVWFTAPKEMEDPFTNSTIHKRFYSPEECIEELVKSGMKRSG